MDALAMLSEQLMLGWMSLDETRRHLSELTAKGEVMTYHSTRFEDGEKTEGIRSRLVGYTPPSAPGRKTS